MSTQVRAVQDKLLTNVSNKIVPMGYISEMILPTMPVKNRTGKVGRYGNQHLRLVNTIAGGRGMYRMRDTSTRLTDTYQIEAHALKDIVTREDFDNVQLPFMAREDATEDLTIGLWLDKEFALAASLADTAVITQNTTLVGPAQFSDFANSDPLDVFITARKTIREAVGMPPNKATMDWGTWQVLRYHPAILEALGFKDNRPGGLTDQELAKVMEVDKLLIAKSVFNNSKEGQADSIEPVWGKHINFMVAPDRAGRKQVTLGYRFQEAGKRPRQVFRENLGEPVGAEKIMVIDDYDQLFTTTNAAFLIKDAIA